MGYGKMRILYKIMFFSLCFVCLTQSVYAATLEVGSGQTYTTVASAINAASNGDIVNIHPGTYDEALEVNKELIIQSSTGDPDDVIFYAKHYGTESIIIADHVLRANNIILKNVTFKLNSLDDLTSSYDVLTLVGTYDESYNDIPYTNITVSNCKFINDFSLAETGDGLSSWICLMTVSDVYIIDCYMEGADEGISIEPYTDFENVHHDWDYNTNIDNCDFVNIGSFCINNYEGGQNIVISDCNFLYDTISADGYPYACYTYGSLEFIDNYVTGMYGIFVCDDCTIQGNTFDDCYTFIELQYSANNVVTNNCVNDSYLFYLLSYNNYNVHDNIIYGNLFYTNTSNYGDISYIYSNNFWNSTEPVTYTDIEGNTHTGVVGNYWLGYSGGDTDGDGIGETPYEINTDIFDYYPLADIVYKLPDDTESRGSGDRKDTVDPYEDESENRDQFDFNNTSDDDKKTRWDYIWEIIEPYIPDWFKDKFNILPDEDENITDTNGTLVITSTPTNANVYIDSNINPKGKTPIEINVEEGSYIVTVKLSGYESDSESITVTGGETKNVKFELEFLDGVDENYPEGKTIVPDEDYSPFDIIPDVIIEEIKQDINDVLGFFGIEEVFQTVWSNETFTVKPNYINTIAFYTLDSNGNDKYWTYDIEASKKVVSVDSGIFNTSITSSGISVSHVLNEDEFNDRFSIRYDDTIAVESIAGEIKTVKVGVSIFNLGYFIRHPTTVVMTVIFLFAISMLYIKKK